jgi:hypothetical protein
MASNWFDSHIGSTQLFLSGLIVIPAFILQRMLPFKAFHVLLYVVLCFTSRRSSGFVFSVIRSLVVLSFVAFFHILTPAGKVLFRLRNFPVTSLALETGLYRGITLIGLFYISCFYVRSDIRLPGTIGRLLGRIFYYFNLLLQESTFDPRRPIKSLDRILMRAYSQKREETSSDVRTSPGGYLFLSVLILISWSLSLIDLLKIRF